MDEVVVRRSAGGPLSDVDHPSNRRRGRSRDRAGNQETGEPDGAPGCVYPAGSAGGDVQIWLTHNDDLFHSLTQNGQAVTSAANPTYTQRIDYQMPSEVAVSSHGDQFVIVYALGTDGTAARIADRTASLL